MRLLSSLRGVRGSIGFLAAAFGLMAAAPPSLAATVFDLVLADGSELVPALGASEPLFGTLQVEIEDPSGIAPTGIRVLSLDAIGGDLVVGLDDAISSPGLGVWFPDESFVIPTLFLVVDPGTGPFAFAIPDVAGTAQIDEHFELLLEASFEIGSAVPAGVVTVNIVAVPEPSGDLLAALTVFLVASVRSRHLTGSGREIGSSGSGGDGRGGRGRARGTGR